MKKCIICDIDGVYVDSSKWAPFIPAGRDDREGWDRFASEVSRCTPNFDIINTLKIVGKFIPILFITSREGSPVLKAATEAQIKVFSENWIEIGDKHKLFMRPYKDYREAWWVKQEILQRDVLPNYKPLLAIDDDLDNVVMFRGFGIPTIYYTKLRK